MRGEVPEKTADSFPPMVPERETFAAAVPPRLTSGKKAPESFRRSSSRDEAERLIFPFCFSSRVPSAVTGASRTRAEKDVSLRLERVPSACAARERTESPPAESSGPFRDRERDGEDAFPERENSPPTVPEAEEGDVPRSAAACLRASPEKAPRKFRDGEWAREDIFPENCTFPPQREAAASERESSPPENRPFSTAPRRGRILERGVSLPLRSNSTTGAARGDRADHFRSAVPEASRGFDDEARDSMKAHRMFFPSPEKAIAGASPESPDRVPFPETVPPPGTDRETDDTFRPSAVPVKTAERFSAGVPRTVSFGAERSPERVISPSKGYFRESFPVPVPESSRPGT